VSNQVSLLLLRLFTSRVLRQLLVDHRGRRVGLSLPMGRCRCGLALTLEPP
jgi:hypothetical protein